MKDLLTVRNLAVSFDTDTGEVRAVKNAGFTVRDGEIYGIVGESGSGKSVSTKTILRLTPANCRIVSGTAEFEGRDVISMPEKEFLPYRGRKMAMIFQDSLTALNPVYTVGSKMVELIRRMDGVNKADAKRKSLDLLREVGITDPDRCFRSYPHELSGGMRQRVMIAMVLACSPKLIIADEPTTSLDVTIQAQILKLLRRIRDEKGMSLVLITHDLGAVAQLCERISVMCGGYIVETGTAEDVFLRPSHPYTKALIASMPKKGRRFEPFLEHSRKNMRDDDLCPFAGRCRYRKEECGKAVPSMKTVRDGHEVRCFLTGEEMEKLSYITENDAAGNHTSGSPHAEEGANFCSRIRSMRVTKMASGNSKSAYKTLFWEE